MLQIRYNKRKDKQRAGRGLTSNYKHLGILETIISKELGQECDNIATV